jgi:F-type H+-transporting ATPase subunit delta
VKGNVLGRRYAGALIEIGKKDGEFERYGKELSAAMEMLGDEKVWSSFTSPLLPVEAKVNVVDELSKRSGWSDSVTKFLKLLVTKKRINILPSIADAYLGMADEAAGRIHAIAQSAETLDDATRARITQKLVGITGKKVVLETKVQPELIGGLRITVGSKVYDGTIDGQLARLKDRLTR